MDFSNWILEEALDCDYLMGMNVQFDIAFIKRMFGLLNINIDRVMPKRQIDPLIVAAAAYDSGVFGDKKIEIRSKDLYDFYEMDSNGIHRSDKDVKLTFELWEKMKKHIFARNFLCK